MKHLLPTCKIIISIIAAIAVIFLTSYVVEWFWEFPFEWNAPIDALVTVWNAIKDPHLEHPHELIALLIVVSAVAVNTMIWIGRGVYKLLNEPT